MTTPPMAANTIYTSHPHPLPFSILLEGLGKCYGRDIIPVQRSQPIVSPLSHCDVTMAHVTTLCRHAIITANHHDQMRHGQLTK